ncbi:putative ABC transporter [Xylanimonas cellulosilytica DSM 15894]|uniref:ABC transporter n=1 Tax=Xylanimonas cellulosilytica (strain DSM 15894 / JCM 12276 / CECT 5975 / KCTC 9989 / LMG 20990 / NBRC 107835 / XIL07) TaxID=446471 RepID=D1BZG8_XYLCX|nr:GTPase [Xylanimonas cellulosilytica]ACZ30122.1 putative ABC transporter [Xylanimonas cellulosilytica DSM 15894]
MSRIDLAGRTAALETAVREATGRLDGPLLDDAHRVITRARERGGLSAEHTVVALAGATGSGKSSVFNAVAGSDLATPGVRRPTTSHALAAIWGPGADPLLDWLDVPTRHELPTGPIRGEDTDSTDRAVEPAPNPRTAGTPARGIAGLFRKHRTPVGITTGLVLLDLPDHDSVVVEHRVRAERLVERADLLVWVVDPQKYADAALHERYLRPLAGRSEIVVVVLNQVDRLAAADAEAMRADLERLVVADGLGGARVLTVSAKTGEGIDQLRGLLAEAAQRREAATTRLALDERAVAARLVAACGRTPSERVSEKAKTGLYAALEDAAGVPVVAEAVRRSALKDAHAATGWPLTRWAGRLRPDPLRRLGLRPDTLRIAADRPDLAVTSLPTARPGVRAAAATAVRAYVDQMTAGAPDPWVLSARRRAQEGLDRLPDALDQAVAGTRLEAGKRPLWWRLVGALQWLVLAAAVAGLLWLGLAFVLSYFQLPPLPTPVLTVGGESWGASGDGVDVPWGTVLVVVGVVAGLLLAAVSRLCAGVGARRRATRARKRLRESVVRVADELVWLPVADETIALTRARTAAVIAAS